jgi:hypothetical protein
LNALYANDPYHENSNPNVSFIFLNLKVRGPTRKNFFAIHPLMVLTSAKKSSAKIRQKMDEKKDNHLSDF